VTCQPTRALAEGLFGADRGAACQALIGETCLRGVVAERSHASAALAQLHASHPSPTDRWDQPVMLLFQALSPLHGLMGQGLRGGRLLPWLQDENKHCRDSLRNNPPIILPTNAPTSRFQVYIFILDRRYSSSSQTKSVVAKP
jgi:hypothetical protein